MLIKDEDGNCVFEPILNDFTLGNFIRCKIDGKIYKMRISDVTIDYNNLSQLSVTFYDITTSNSMMSKAKSLLSTVKSIGTSYSYTQKQASQGEKANYTLDKLREEGLNSAQYNIFNTNSTFIMDDHGLLGRNYDDINDQYANEQIRINGCNIIMTDNDFKSTRLAIGKQKYTLNGTTYEKYGVNADFCIASEIIGGDIYSANYKTDTNGNIIQGNHFDLTGSNFELADGNIIYNKDKNKFIFKNVTMEWSTINNLSTSDIDGLDDKFDSELRSYVQNTVFADCIDELQKQVDGNITTWFQMGEPTLDNYPANEWTTDRDKNIHLGDLYYDNYTGYAYRFQYNNSKYSWVKITDSDVTKALADAKNAQDTADGKRRVFVTTPIPPYDKGDLWTQGENGDILKCVTAKKNNQNYSETDWELASKYTDDTTANEAKQLLSDYKLAINAAFGITSTKIDQNTVIAPIIGGGKLTISNGKQSVQIDSTSSTIFKVLNGTTDVMGIDSLGNGYFHGKITATSGKISDFNIIGNKLYAETSTNGYGSGLGLISNSSDANIAIWAGSSSAHIGDAPFIVYHDGSIKSSKGYIGGWEITEKELLFIKENTIMSRLSPHQLWVSEKGNGDNYSHILPTTIFTHSISSDGKHNYVFHADMNKGILILYDANSPQDVVFSIDLARKIIGIGEGWATPWG